VPRFEDDPPGVPLEFVGRLGQTWFIDTNIIGSDLASVRRLIELRREGWLRLVKADMLDTELGGDTNDERRVRLETESADFEELLGPGVWDHSRWDHAVWGSKDDSDLIEAVFATIFPNKSRDATSKNNVRDALHVSTAIRYGADGFVTLDRKGLLKASADVRAAYNGFHIMDPDTAVAVAERLVARSLEVRRRGAAGPVTE
jgi:hypothetical protein